MGKKKARTALKMANNQTTLKRSNGEKGPETSTHTTSKKDPLEKKKRQGGRYSKFQKKTGQRHKKSRKENSRTLQKHLAGPWPIQERKRAHCFE